MGNQTSLQLAVPFMFPAPKASYTYRTMGSPPLYAIDGVPCLWYKVPSARVVLLYAHANGVDLGVISGKMQQLARQTGCSVVAVEYPGYGACFHDDRSIEGAVSNVLRVYFYLARVSALPIVLVGRSIGTGVVGQAARRLCRRARPGAPEATVRPPAGVVLLSPFRSVAHMAPRELRAALAGVYDTEEAVAHIPCPTTVVHGDEDPLIDVAQGRAVHAASRAARKALVILPGSTHDTLDWRAVHGAVAALVRHLIST